MRTWSETQEKSLSTKAPAGSWMEFGVWEGATLNGVADYRKVNCDQNAAPVFGFDTFTGLPEAWGSFRPTVCFSQILPYLPTCLQGMANMATFTWLPSNGSAILQLHNLICQVMLPSMTLQLSCMLIDKTGMRERVGCRLPNMLWQCLCLLYSCLGSFNGNQEVKHSPASGQMHPGGCSKGARASSPVQVPSMQPQ